MLYVTGLVAPISLCSPLQRCERGLPAKWKLFQRFRAVPGKSWHATLPCNLKILWRLVVGIWMFPHAPGKPDLAGSQEAETGKPDRGSAARLVRTTRPSPASHH